VTAGSTPALFLRCAPCPYSEWRLGGVAGAGSVVSFAQLELDALLADATKRTEGDIDWAEDEDQKHQHTYTEQYRDKDAYVPQDITAVVLTPEPATPDICCGSKPPRLPAAYRGGGRTVRTWIAILTAAR